MNYLDEALKRANLTQLCSFLLYGSELGSPPSDCSQWLVTAEESMYQRLCRELPNPDTLDDVLSLIYDYASAIQYTYMKLGAKTGLQLALELHNFP